MALDGKAWRDLGGVLHQVLMLLPPRIPSFVFYAPAGLFIVPCRCWRAVYNYYSYHSSCPSCLYSALFYLFLSISHSSLSHSLPLRCPSFMWLCPVVLSNKFFSLPFLAFYLREKWFGLLRVTHTPLKAFDASMNQPDLLAQSGTNTRYTVPRFDLPKKHHREHLRFIHRQKR